MGPRHLGEIDILEVPELAVLAFKFVAIGFRVDNKLRRRHFGHGVVSCFRLF
jgi:hypothetical protein